MKTTDNACREYHVVSHTHWDREWYLNFETFRLRLVDLVDHLLEIYDRYPDYVFHLDAQTVCLEDYLEIRPHRRDRLRQLIAGGQLLVGPWYVQNDFHLTSGEATLRNLLIGSAIASDFGRCERVGYVPDQFGLISQLPQILKQFGIDNAVFGRGYSFYREKPDATPEPGNPLWAFTREPRPSEFLWESPDGSAVPTVHLVAWYNNAQRFSSDPDRAFRYLKHIDERLAPFSTTPCRLLMNGVDHLEAQDDLLPILEGLQQRLGEEGTIRQSTLSQYIQRVLSHLNGSTLPRVAGELRFGHDLEMLQGTLSSRRYLKTLNSRCQTRLELELEPFCAALASHTGGRVPYPADELRYLWKELLKNHAHDSICGCSVDRVHQDNENRFLRILDAAESLRQRGLKALLDRVNRAGLTESDYLVLVANPLPYPRSEVVTAQVQLPLEARIEGFRLLAPDGTPVDYEVVASSKHNRMTLSPLNLPGQLAVETLTLRFAATELPPSGYAVYRLTPDASARKPVSTESAAPGPVRIENEWLALEVLADGAVRLNDKENKRTIERLFTIEDAGDLGDSYCYLPGHDSLDLSGFLPRVTLVERSALQQTVRLDYALVLPEAYDRKVKRRTGSVENRLVMTLTLRKHSRVVDIAGTVENKSRGHRLRLRIHTGIDCATHVAGQPFDAVERPRHPPFPALTQDPTHPVTGWVALRQNDSALGAETPHLDPLPQGERKESVGDERADPKVILRGANPEAGSPLPSGERARVRVVATESCLPRDGVRQATVFTDDVFDYEHLDDASGTLAFTLVRATGRIINDLFGADDNGVAPAPEWAVPENQCLRSLTFRLGLRCGACGEAALWREQQAWVSPAMTVFDSVDPHKFMGGRPCVQAADLHEMFYNDLSPEETSLPLRAAGIHLCGDVVASAYKQREDRQGYLVRVFNPASTPARCEIGNLEGFRVVGLDETPQGAPVPGPYRQAVPPKRIATLQLNP
jgi:alpha-mannosidase